MPAEDSLPGRYAEIAFIAFSLSCSRVHFNVSSPTESCPDSISLGAKDTASNTSDIPG